MEIRIAEELAENDTINSIVSEQDNETRKSLLSSFINSKATPPVNDFYNKILDISEEGSSKDTFLVRVFLYNGDVAISVVYQEPTKDQLDSAWLIGEHRC